MQSDHVRRLYFVEHGVEWLQCLGVVLVDHQLTQLAQVYRNKHHCKHYCTGTKHAENPCEYLSSCIVKI